MPAKRCKKSKMTKHEREEQHEWACKSSRRMVKKVNENGRSMRE